MVRKQVVELLVFRIKTLFYVELLFAMAVCWPVAFLVTLLNGQRPCGPVAFAREYVDVFWPALQEHLRTDPSFTIGELVEVSKRLPKH